ncbi:MAG: ABC transporter ATP-binding protein/permease [Sphaerochaetaceae bacterium]|nr:ABC transporter ATP-binding protein/permease [Sphaerochaetaceae bacterium]
MAINKISTSKPKDGKKALKRILSFVKQYRLLILLSLALSFTSNVLSLIGPSLAGNAINEASAGAGKVNFPLVLHYVRLMLLVYVSSSLITILINVIMANVAKLTAKKLRKECFEKLSRLPVSFFDHNLAGDIISRVSYDIDVIATSLQTDIVQIMTSVVTVLGALVMMLRIAPVLAVVVLVTIPISVTFTIYIKKKTRPLFIQRSKNYGKMNGFVEEMFSGEKTIQAYAYENQVCENFAQVNGQAAEAYWKADYHGVSIGPTMGMINNICLGLIATLGSFFYMMQIVSLGQISSFILYSRKFSGPINEIANVMNEILSALSAAERVFHLLDQPEEVADKEDAVQLLEVDGDVRFRNVSFGYDPERTILHDLSFDAQPGKLIAIVGPTGAGKTTIINLLMRFYDYNKGTVLVDGKDEMDYLRSSLRAAYAMVLQETWLFRGTIFENIAYGRENATMEDVVRVAKKAHIHPFIMRLPKGYDTVISEDGGNISKGQKQLLTIARAMLYDSKMLILDEATSNVDTSTEREIQDAMRELMHDKTCFVIAHRLSTIQNADNILVLDHGDVVEQGTHAQLMEKKGFYYKLYAAQFE